MLLNCGVGEDSWESLGLQGDTTSLGLGSWSRLFIGRTDGKAETPILWPPDEKNWLIGKDPDAGKDWRQEEKGTTEDEMVQWHHQLNGHESEWTLGIVDGQGGLACCSPWGRKESDMTEWLNWCDTETRIWVQVVSLGGDPRKHLWRKQGSERGRRRKLMREVLSSKSPLWATRAQIRWGTPETSVVLKLFQWGNKEEAGAFIYHFLICQLVEGCFWGINSLGLLFCPACWHPQVMNCKVCPMLPSVYGAPQAENKQPQPWSQSELVFE